MARRRRGLSEDTFIFSEAQASNLLGISPRKLVAIRRSRAGPPFRYVGSRIRYCLTDLFDFMNNQPSVPSGPDK
jgi:hypothetical protein